MSKLVQVIICLVSNLHTLPVIRFIGVLFEISSLKILKYRKTISHWELEVCNRDFKN